VTNRLDVGHIKLKGACESKFPYLFDHYTQGFVSLQGEQEIAKFRALSLLF